MKQRGFKVAVCALLLTVMLAMSFVAFAQSAAASPAQEVVTITMYPASANLQSGLVGGFKGNLFAEHGFALEVWAYSDERTNVILASGDMPDIMYVSTENLDTMIEGGMLLNLDDYVDLMPNIKNTEVVQNALNFIREYRSAGTGSLYSLPLTVKSPTGKDDFDNRNTIKINWDVYQEIGAPEFNTIWELIPVVKQMMEARPIAEDGTPYFGTYLNSGSDTTYWACMQLFYRWHGYMETSLPYLLETDMCNATYSSILSTDSLYYEGLKWYNTLYREGLMDPDSINNDRATQKAKVDRGYAMLPSGSLPGWAPRYYSCYLEGVNYSPEVWEQTFGDPNWTIGINAKTTNLDACLAFFNLLADPDAYFNVVNGPEGEAWNIVDGAAVGTDEAINALLTGEEYFYSTGEKQELWSTAWIITDSHRASYMGPEGKNRLIRMTDWPEIMAMKNDNDGYRSWQAKMGYDNWVDLVEDKGVYYPTSDLQDVNMFVTIPDDTMQLTIDAIKDVVVNASWAMVYAESDEAFEKLWDQMLADCEGLGAQDIIDWRLADLENAKAIKDSLAE